MFYIFSFAGKRENTYSVSDSCSWKINLKRLMEKQWWSGKNSSSIVMVMFACCAEKQAKAPTLAELWCYWRTQLLLPSKLYIGCYQPLVDQRGMVLWSSNTDLEFRSHSGVFVVPLLVMLRSTPKAVRISSRKWKD